MRNAGRNRFASREMRASPSASPTPRVLLALAAMLVLAVPVPASAASQQAVPPGVHIDPNSPPAQEYAIPLDQARTAGRSATGGNGLFGSGIRTADNSGSSAGPVHRVGGSLARTSSSDQRHDAGANVAGRYPAAPTPAQLRAAREPPRGETGIAWMLGAAALVLALGGVAARVIARHNRGTSLGTR